MLRQLTSVSLVVFALTSPAFADSAAPQQPVDESGLRYYASLGQKNRVAAESRRLVKLDPAWHAPDDLYSAHPGRPDEGPLWLLYGQNRMDDLGAAIAMRQSAEPGWMPSDDLASKIKTKALRAHVMELAKAEDWHAIVESFKGSGIAWAKDDAEALWVVAEAYARENDCGEAYIVYRSILADHTDIAARRATIEHAIALVPMSYAEKLIAMGHADANGQSEFAPIAIDITRARISAYLHDEPANDVGDDELKAFQAFVQEAKDPNEPGLVAWYAFKRRDYPQALDWFKLAISHGGDAMIAHGLAHTLRMLGMKREAEEVAFAWREPLVNNAILFIDLLETDLTKERPPYIEPARIARYAQVSMTTESGEGAHRRSAGTPTTPASIRWRCNGSNVRSRGCPRRRPLTATRLRCSACAARRISTTSSIDTTACFRKWWRSLFDDGIRKPPPPCEADPRNPSAPPRPVPVLDARPGPDWTGRTMADTLRPQTIALYERSVETSGSLRARVPSPDALAAGTDGTQPPLTKKTEFPSAVSPENPLRFSTLRTVATEDQRGRPRDASWPLVARRVPGVGAMPYERYGFTLMPGWDGTADASSPTSADRAPPQGTLWALEQSLRDDATVSSTRQSNDPLSRQPLAKATIDISPRSDRRS